MLKKYPAVEEARNFGSRALGTERPNSDIDVVGYSLLEHQKLKEPIDRHGKSFYQR